ncbi:alpha-2-macroglobulin family protein [Aridibaculum aurantiacum]|uniref:alpha-2-macroglobulin family protein n=1 Tax=Aridibaculum aurantiacum TaxID=2810307 RepID=UPI001A97C0EF|nr:MG2 domain-containing protein [Aridibaculum aurantiacum]
MQRHPASPLFISGMLLLFITLISSCNNKKEIAQVDPEFSKYIEAYTSGVVSKKNSIRIQLTSDVSTTHAVNETIKEELFDFSPAVKGKAYWTDERTIEFKPDNDMKPGELYEVSFKLSKVRKVPEKFKNFKFNVQVIKPSFTVIENGLRALNGYKDAMILSGTLQTADVEESSKIASLLKVSQQGASPTIKWQHNEANKTHNFTIEGIKRQNAASTLLLQWDGKPLNIDQKDQLEIAVPAIGDFKVLNVRAVQEAEEYVLVQFSDPIATNQQLEGLIAVSEQEDMSFTINGSEVKAYSSTQLDGNYKVNINSGITNLWGNRLEKAFTANIFFENRLPVVKIHGRGTILPASDGKLVLPFEATNLKAIDVSIIKIHENNVSQFLQLNDLKGESEIRRVGKPLAKATIKLDNDPSLNLHKKNRFSLDIDKYIRAEPGAIYRVHIGFRPEYSLYTCAQTAEAKDEEDEEYYNEWSDEGSDNGVDEDDEFWESYDSYYPYGYNWSQRDNPCSRSYFNKERFASRNIIATNIGLSARKGNDNNLLVAATNIISTEPMAGVEVEVMDYQRQVIAKGKTSSDGIATIEVKRKPFLLVAKNGNEKSYLKLDDGSALPLSRFDVSGAEVKNGIKGFIFGERGVWRLGDSLYLSCIIEDKERKLPKDHPIEMELYAPSGQLYKKMVQVNAEDGFNIFRTATDAGAPTGNWNCKVKLGGAHFEKKIKIETVMPNRLKIDLDFGANPQLGADATPGKLAARWLFGATAKSLKARVDVALYRSTTTFPKYEGYTFDNPTADFEPQSKTIFDGALSETGTADIKPNFTINTEAPGVLKANLLVKVFEPGGNFSIDNVSYPYHAYSSYVGVKVPEGAKPWGYLEAGKTHRLEVAHVDVNGKAKTGNSTLQVELYKVQWRWWWDNSSDNLSNFSQDEYNKLIKKETITIANGKGSYPLKINSENWGRYLVLIRDGETGHVTGKTFYVDDPYWQARDNKDDPTAASMLSFTSDKLKYNAGEEVKLSIPSSKGGRAFISIENGSKVIKTYWTETQQGQTTFSFKAEKEMTPNVYVNVSLIQPHAQTINDLPIRMYGVIPVMVEDKNTILKPVIKMADAVRPEQPNNITISEASGKPMTYVIAIVDEGLLDLTRYKTPDPHKAFYTKEALGVKTWDLYDYVIGAWAGGLERILTIGGDNEGDGPGNKKANRFPPVVKFMGPFKSNGGSKTHSFVLPPYMGSVRAMVIAAGNGAYGAAEKAVAVKKPLMLLGTTPRVLGPTEQVRIPLTVFATENNIRNVSLSLQTNQLLQAENSTQNISFSATGEQQVYFNARVRSATGVGKIKFIATSGNERAEYEVELDVRNPNPPITTVQEHTLNGGQGFNTAIAAIGTGGNKAVVEISSIPAMNLEKRLQYLITYPHGCIEQVTSSAFPQLVLNQMVELNNQQQAQVQGNIRRAVERIKNFQSTDGGFSYWPGNRTADEWGTNYAGHFLLEASDRGYNIPSSLLQQWRGYQRTKANTWNQTSPVYYGGDLVQAYRLYLLALAKAPELGAMNRLKEYKFITPEAKWRLAAAYHLAGQTQVALQLISGLPTNFSQRAAPGITYGSNLRDQAMVLETLTIMGRRAEAERLARAVAQQLSKENWYSTQTTAYALIAVGKFCGKNPNGNRVTITGNVAGNNVNLNSTSPVAQLPVSFSNGKANINLTNKGSNVLYVRIINQGQPVAGDTMQVSRQSAYLATNVSFTTTSGAPIDPSSITQGTDFIAKVTVKNTGQRGTYNEMALSQVFPSGWEILNTRMYSAEGAFKSSPAEYMDIRDDRVYHYFDIRQNETLTYYVQLTAAYPGRYYWPGVYCEAMYDNSISAGVNGKWVEVK